ncbi:MAG: hypothetical protein V9G18_14420 [Albidovulum sp.]
MRRPVGEFDPHHGAAAEGVGPGAALDPPKEEVHVGLALGKLAPRPALPPDAHCLDQGRELRPGRGQVVASRPAVAPPLDDALALQLAQALRQERRRHQRHAAPDLREPMRAPAYVAQDQRVPPRAEHLCRLGDRAELAIAPHRPLRFRPVTGGR